MYSISARLRSLSQRIRNTKTRMHEPLKIQIISNFLHLREIGQWYTIQCKYWIGIGSRYWFWNYFTIFACWTVAKQIPLLCILMLWSEWIQKFSSQLVNVLNFEQRIRLGWRQGLLCDGVTFYGRKILTINK
jgi:hypothetical protein